MLALENDVSEKLKNLIVKQLKIDRDPKTIPDTEQIFGEGLGLDSIDSLELIIGIEKEFGITITDKDLKKPEELFKNIETLAKFIETRITEKK